MRSGIRLGHMVRSVVECGSYWTRVCMCRLWRSQRGVAAGAGPRRSGPPRARSEPASLLEARLCALWLVTAASLSRFSRAAPAWGGRRAANGGRARRPLAPALIREHPAYQATRLPGAIRASQRHPASRAIRRHPAIRAISATRLTAPCPRLSWGPVGLLGLSRRPRSRLVDILCLISACL